MYILIDDEKNYGADIIVRNPVEAEWLLQQLTPSLQAVTTVGIDFDLGDPERTGEDVLRHTFEAFVFPVQIQIVSMNPVGRARISSLLIDYGYASSDGSNFIRK